MKLTPWFSGDQRPVRDGVYQRDYGNGGPPFYAKWARGWWWVGSPQPEFAAVEQKESIYQDVSWRGVAK